MTTLQQQKVLESKRLHLTKRRTLRYYSDTLIVSFISIILLLFIVKGFISRSGYYNSPYLLIFLIFPGFACYLFVKQTKSLFLKELETSFTKQDNYKIAKETLQILKWHIRIDNKGFIEANTDSFGFLTWTDQMISILITDNKILLNSICNVDTYATQAITWGQNTRNMKKFIGTFERLSTKYSR